MKKEDNQLAIIMDGVNDDTAIKDFEASRANLYTVLEVAKEAVQRASEVASASQLPDAYLALSNLIKSTVDANKQLLLVQEKIRDITSASASPTGKAKTVNNNLFVGTTTDLQRMLQELDKK